MKPSAEFRLHGNSVGPVYRAVRTLAARSLLGHASLAMTSRYAKPDLTEARKAVDEIG